MRKLAHVILFVSAFALPAAAQTTTPDTTGLYLAQLTAKPPAAGSKGGVRISQPLSAELTANECRKLGGKTEIDDGGSCKNRMRCTITHANGDVYSSCIDELE